MSTFPCLELTSNSRGSLNSIQLNVENQVCNNAHSFCLTFIFTLFSKFRYLHLWEKHVVLLVFFGVMNVEYNINFSWLITFSRILLYVFKWISR